ncbi:hypothetical protein HUZ36_05200 [Pseudoalteromonas sp. McH1-7]|uniref:hypothetical protein n=1 Tax=Pseudoalteromonas sp. McH1-7 TaxID=2745574 RepID=UPI001590A999|nr:hypothetical protein [Pseudoalteromonas sp. McH1-7]NUZ10171.1 hypothetical protein [Pseudoalteromonas sp. McH1-7]
MQQKTMISIPETVSFSELKLSRSSNGVVFDWQPIIAICEASGVDPDMFRQSQEDNVSALIIQWYAAHKSAGGEPDDVAEELIAEVMQEDQLGGGFSHLPGKA